MASGQNRKLIAEPQAYAQKRTILVPDHSLGSYWDSRLNGPFDLVPISGSGFDGKVVALTQVGRWHHTADEPIHGVWVPYGGSGLVTEKIKPGDVTPYFVFTSRLGGCAIGMKKANEAETIFAHEARYGTASPVNKYDAKFVPGESDEDGQYNDALNVTAFYYWDGNEWHLGRSLPYNAHYLTQNLADNPLDKYPMCLNAPPEKTQKIREKKHEKNNCVIC